LNRPPSHKSFVASVAGQNRAVVENHRTRRPAPRDRAGGCGIVRHGCGPVTRAGWESGGTIVRSELVERPQEHAPTGVQQRRVNMDAIELWSSVHKTIDMRGCASLPYVGGVSVQYRLIVGVVQRLQFRRRYRSGHDGRTVAMQSFNHRAGSSLRLNNFRTVRVHLKYLSR